MICNKPSTLLLFLGTRALFAPESKDFLTDYSGLPKCYTAGNREHNKNKIYTWLTKLKHFLNNKKTSSKICVLKQNDQLFTSIHTTLHAALDLLDKAEPFYDQHEMSINITKLLLLVNQAKDIRKTLIHELGTLARKKQGHKECPIETALWEAMQYYCEKIDQFLTKVTGGIT